MTTLTLDLPPQFVALCEADEVKPEEVLRSFIADLCALDNSGGDDERDLAQGWYDRRVISQL
jgi:hypothetical protein